MDKTFLAELQVYKKLIDNELALVLRDHLKYIDHTYGSFSTESINSFRSITERGGKRLRGLLLIQSYFMFGGKDKQLAIKAAAAIELIHAYLLIIDDICDQSELRRGGPAAHKILELYHDKKCLPSNGKHFGESIAINAAIYGMHFASNLILLLDTQPEIIIKAHQNINDNLLVTAHGQINDIFNESLKNIDNEMIRNVLAWKTGYYTFLNPMELGAILSNTAFKDMEKLKSIALNLGVAYQIEDDIIGMFGDSSVTGKSNMDDLREGKMTLLVEVTLKKSSQKNKNKLLGILGKKDLLASDLAYAQNLIKQTGALDQLKAEAENKANQAINELKKLKCVENKHREFIIKLALYMRDRNK